MQRECYFPLVFIYIADANTCAWAARRAVEEGHADCALVFAQSAAFFRKRALRLMGISI